MDAASHSLSTVFGENLEQISLKWLVGILLLISMTLQLVLVVLGARRYHSSGASFRFVVWGAYISADAVAISALGNMMHSSWSEKHEIYGIWAPVLLLHLGGPDAITAYSVADNELWLRHGFNMVYQVLVAMYVIYASALEGHALASAILLLVAGATKYGERTLALWYASDSQIVTSCLPISKYLRDGNVVKNCRYAVMGEEQLQRMTEILFRASSTGRRDIEARPEATPTEGRDIEARPEATPTEGRDIEAQPEGPPLEGRGIVTIKDVEDAHINKEDYNLCLSHALFKMYMRRFVSLYFNEGDWKETRAFWVELSGKEAFRIVETELKFMYDVLFSKGSSTAFSRFGIVLRLLNCLLMGAAGFLILREREAQWTVTYVVISVALVVEVYQFCRIMTSDWTRVRLICARVDDIRHPSLQSAVKWCRLSILKMIEIAVLVLGKVQNVVGGDRYWSDRIHQHCLIGTCLSRSRFVWRMVKFFPKVDSYIASWHIHKVSVQEDLKNFIFNILKVKCSPRYDSETCRGVLYNFEEDLLEDESAIRNVIPSHDNLEEVILVWHIATTICDKKRESLGEIENENVRYSRILSRYCAYLLLSRPRLLPVHPDIASITYLHLVEQLMGKKYYGKDPTELSSCRDQSVLGSGAELASGLLGKGEDERWKLLAEYWAGLVIYMAVYNKATFHAECVAGGGEFLSQVWVLVGHMGCGEQSDSAVRKKIEMPVETELRRIKLERQRLEGERLEQDLLERERLERERLQRDRLERERMARDLQQWDHLERERLERERQERDHAEQERLAQGRLERDHLERERLTLERLERDRKAREGLESDRLKRDRVEGERLGRERLDQDRLKQEGLERDRIERAHLEQKRLEWNHVEGERLERERLEGDRLKQEQLDQNCLEWDRMEQIRLEGDRNERDRLERDRLERERLERDRLHRNRLEWERLEEDSLKRERLERERLEKDRLERERLERERLEKDHLERERLAQDRLESDRVESERLEEDRSKQEPVQGSRRILKRVAQTLGKLGRELFVKNRST